MARDQQVATVPASRGDREENLANALDSSHVYVQLTSTAPETTVQEHIEREVALLSPFIQREVLRAGRGVSDSEPVMLPKQVTAEVLKLLLEYCRYHRQKGYSDKERKKFDEKFIKLDTRRLCELTSAADSLEMKPLVDLTSRALARMIEGKSPEEIRATFNLPDDLTEEEKLEPLKSGLADARIKLLNKLYAKKRQSLAVKKAAIGKAPALLATNPAEDRRSLDQLLDFIQDGAASGSKAKGKAKRKKGRKKSLGGAEDNVQQLDGDEAAATNGYAAVAAPSGTAAAQADALAAAAEEQLRLRTGDAAEADAAQPSHQAAPGGVDSDGDIDDLALRLQADWPARRAEMVSTLTSLRDFRARLPNGASGAASGSDFESSDFCSDYDSEEEYTDEDDASTTDADELQPAASVAAVDDAATMTPVAAAAPPSSARAGSAPASRQAAQASRIAAPAPQRKGTAAQMASSDACGVPQPAASGAPAGNGSCARTAAKPPMQRTPPSSDFQAFAGVLRHFLAAAEASPVMQLSDGDRQAARLSMVRGEDGSLTARTDAGSSIQLTWRFPDEGEL